MSAAHPSQEWLSRRLECLQPDDFDEGLVIYSLLPCQPPPQFRHMWINYHDSDPQNFQPPENLEQMRAILFFCHPADESQVLGLHQLLRCLDATNLMLPRLVWVPHSVAPGNIWDGFEPQLQDGGKLAAAFKQICETGIDAIVMGEPAGFKLALAVRGRIMKLGHLTRRAAEAMEERRAQAQYLSQVIDNILWHYLRDRLAKIIPPVDPNLPSGQIQHVGGYTLGRMLGRGAYGSVFQVLPVGDDPTEPPTVMKVVSKSIVKDVGDLQGLRRQIEVMQLLSSEKWVHPNLAEFYDVYHSPTHLFLHMEYGGPENLFRRLQDREKQGDAQRPLSWARCSSLITQAITVLAHIHLGPKVCHRDVKPENIIVSDAPGQPLHLKLVDFDLALTQKEGCHCRSSCGTVPFSAPEVLLSRQYNGMAADIWSLGIVMIEILCGVRIVERALALEQVRHGGHPERAVGARIQEAFSSMTLLRDILERKFRQELAPLRDVSEQFLSRMLVIDPTKRLDSKGMMDVIFLFPQQAVET
eukprot:CAMPEP_0203874496 /NCGR_PEP_ID=MMETSP0359-20131031/20304_1 /ASSEMBLY_ACC=CAM_ASM_000338 /TAXON_ID=268821 /ORGANISM="Scrippsiella Hangoei, Strain SHTV-5" /LENGTH=526 /DNA_ID=CAMNT_0050793245 /DNA_START=44 /DNA_END=1624 /DNA_ORIENTATION=-